MMFMYYVIIRVCFTSCLCPERPGTLQVLKVTALIRVTSIRLKVDDPP